MYEAIMMAATGLVNQQRRLDTIADNVANINTAGFKASRLDFKDALYTAGVSTGPVYSPDGNLQKGHGVMTASITKLFSGGSLLATESELDFAIEGDGFFEVKDSYGALLYTQAGNFYTSTEADGMYLVNSQGYYVQSGAGTNILIPEGTTEISVSTDGLITFRMGDEILGTESLGIYMFTNKMGLSSAGNANYEVTIASGEKMEADDFKVRQHYLEGSNVNLADEMTRLIRTQRAFSLASRALTTADDMEAIANNMKG